MSVYAFGAGFFGGLNKRMDEDMAYIREQRQKRRDYLMSTGTEALRKTEATANQAIATANKLKQLGMSDTNINYIVEQSGPNGLLEVLDVVGKTPSLVRDPNALNKIVTGAVETGEPTSYIDTIKQQFGLYQSTPNPVERERKGFFANLGVDPDEAVNAVYNETFAGGYTGADLIRMTTSSGPTVTGAAPIDYANLPYSLSSNQAATAFVSVGNVTDTAIANSIASVKQQISETEGAQNEQLQKTLNFLEEQQKLPATDRNYELLMQQIPTLRSGLLSIEERVPGSLKYNDVFKLTSAYDILFPKAGEVTPELDEQTKGALGGEGEEEDPNGTDSDKAKQESLALAKKEYPELDGKEVENIPTVMTEEEAVKAGYDFVFIGDQLYKVEPDNKVASIDENLRQSIGTNLSEQQITTFLKLSGNADLANDPAFVSALVEQNKEASFDKRAVETVRGATETVVDAVDNIVKKIEENKLPDIIEPTEEIDTVADQLLEVTGNTKDVPLIMYVQILEDMGRTDITEDEDKLQQLAYTLSLKINGEDSEVFNFQYGPPTRPDVKSDGKRVPGRAIVRAFKNFMYGTGVTDPGEIVRRSSSSDSKPTLRGYETQTPQPTAPSEEAGVFIQTAGGKGENLRLDRTGGNVTRPVMQRPDETPSVQRLPEATPADIAAISDMVTRLAGSGSGVATLASNIAKGVASGDRTLRAADLTRIINQVRELPRTDARKELLAELYDLRDEVNKR